MKLTQQTANAYFSQLVGLFGLLLLNFILPIIIGVEVYGTLVFALSITYVSVTIIDEGANLLIAKNGVDAHVLAIKFLFGGLVCIIVISGLKITVSNAFAYLIQTLSYILYTSLISLFTYHLKNEYLPLCGAIFSLLSFCLPLLAFLHFIEMHFATTVAFMLSTAVAFVIATHTVSLSSQGEKCNDKGTTLMSTKLESVFSVSIPLGVYGFILWLGVFVLGSNENFEEASTLRIALSGVGLLSFLVPAHRNTLAREFKVIGLKAIKAPIIYSALIILATLVITKLFGTLILVYLYGPPGVLIAEKIVSFIPLFAIKIFIDFLLIVNNGKLSIQKTSGPVLVGTLLCASLYYSNYISYIVFSYCALLWTSACLAVPFYKKIGQNDADKY